MRESEQRCEESENQNAGLAEMIADLQSQLVVAKDTRHIAAPLSSPHSASGGSGEGEENAESGASAGWSDLDVDDEALKGAGNVTSGSELQADQTTERASSTEVEVNGRKASSTEREKYSPADVADVLELAKLKTELKKTKEERDSLVYVDFL